MILKKIYSGTKQQKTFLASVRIYTATNILEKAMPFLLMPVLTRLLSLYDYGIITTFNAVRNNIDPVISMSTPGAVGRAYFDREKKGFNFGCYTYNAVMINFAFMFLALSIVLILKNYIPGFHVISVFWLLLVPLFVWAAATSNIKVKLWIYQHNPKPYGIYRVMKVLTEMALSILIVVFLVKTWQGRIIGIGIAETLFCIVALYLLWKRDKMYPLLNLRYIKDILKFGLPLLPHSFGWMLIATADKYFLNYMVGVSVTGVYGVAYTLAALIPLLASPIDISAEPIIYEKIAKLDNHTALGMVLLSYLYFLLLIAAAIILWLLSPLILKIMVDKKFYGATEFILWLGLGYAAHGMYRLFSKYIAYSKKTYLMAYNTLVAGLVGVIANYGLIKMNGAVGAAQATCLAYMTSFLLTWWMANRLYPMPWFSIFKPQNLKGLFDTYRKR